MVFTRPDCRPLGPRAGWSSRMLLTEARIGDRRLYGGIRHTSGTWLLGA